jgi:hypothetical protein
VVFEVCHLTHILEIRKVCPIDGIPVIEEIPLSLPGVFVFMLKLSFDDNPVPIRDRWRVKCDADVCKPRVKVLLVFNCLPRGIGL